MSRLTSAQARRSQRRDIAFLTRRKPSVAKQALSMAKRNRRNIKIISEVVQGAVTTATDVFDPTPIVDYLSNIAGNGTTAKFRSVRVKGTIKRNVASALIDDWRVDLILDRVPDGAEVTPLELYGDATPTIGAFKNALFKKRFRILRSEFGAFDESGNGNASHMIDWYVKLNLVTETVANDSWAIGSVLKNAIFLVYWTTAAANHPIPALQTIVYIDSDGA